jgi:hydroxymethylpyrimidine pyrophosphatase-like HAD family hydrolase
MDALAGLVETTHSNPDDVLLEMSAHGVTKGSTLRMVAEELGIAAQEVAAVGDMPNDIPMLLWAGASYAVADAHPAAKSAAGSVIGPNSAESVADLIEAILATQ